VFVESAQLTGLRSRWRASQKKPGVARLNRPGGRFAWNAFAFDPHVSARLDGQHQDEPVPHTIGYAVGDDRIDIVLDDGGTSSIWWATKNEWLGLIDVAGLELDAFYGDFARTPLADGASEYVVVTRLPAGDATVTR
jgi:hypothetical protein